MGYQELLNGELFSIHRGKINAQTKELYNTKIEASDVLLKANTTYYWPVGAHNPATKGYADNVLVSWKNVYDPTGVNSDVFDRDNHYGNIAASVITQDQYNRFVTDTEKLTWNGKEDLINPKNSAFNKSFGSSSEQVARGDHGHTKSDVGLGNVDNTADIAKPISTDVQQALNVKLNNNVAEFIPTTQPLHLEGRVLYDTDEHALVVHSDIPGVRYRLGLGVKLRAINGGTQLAPGIPCRVSSSTGVLPNVSAASAATIPSANVIGLTTVDVSSLQETLLITDGVLNGINTSQFDIGDTLFLGNSAGEISTSPGDIITKIGTALNSRIDGSILVDIDNYVVLPTIMGALIDSSFPATINATPAIISNFVSSYSNLATVDAPAGTIQIVNSGLYRLSSTINFSHNDIGNNSGTVTLHLYNSSGIEVDTMTFALLRNQISTNMSVSMPFEAVDNAIYQLRISSDVTLTTGAVHAVTFDLTSISLSI